MDEYRGIISKMHNDKDTELNLIERLKTDLKNNEDAYKEKRRSID